jgi:hypothetical protein
MFDSRVHGDAKTTSSVSPGGTAIQASSKIIQIPPKRLPDFLLSDGATIGNLVFGKKVILTGRMPTVRAMAGILLRQSCSRLHLEVSFTFRALATYEALFVSWQSDAHLSQILHSP